MKIERRKMNVDQIQVAKDAAGMPVLRGIAAPYNEVSSTPIAGMFYERFQPGSFKRALADKDTDVVAVLNHDTQAIPFARFTGGEGTLKLSQDERGLSYEFTPPDTERARELVQAIERKDIRGMSFAFVPKEEKWDKSYRNLPLREISDADLFDICFATTPYYSGTTVSARGEKADETTDSEYRALVSKNAGLSEQERKRKLKLLQLKGI